MSKISHFYNKIQGWFSYPTEPTWGDVYKVVEELFPNRYESRIEESCFLVRK